MDFHMRNFITIRDYRSLGVKRKNGQHLYPLIPPRMSYGMLI